MSRSLTLPLAAALAALAACSSSSDYAYEESGSTSRVAVAELQPLDGSGVRGTITFEETDGGQVRIHGTVRGLQPGKHGFHVHEGTSCDDRGGHFAPDGSPHGAPTDARRHVGDLGNLVAADDGTARYDRTDRRVKLDGPSSIVGHVLVVHAGEDDLRSQPSGDAGEQIACGVIELRERRR